MTDAQERAGLSVMRGTFRHADVRRALHRAGVAIDKLANATDNLLRREREAGRIRLEKLDGEHFTVDDRWIKV